MGESRGSEKGEVQESRTAMYYCYPHESDRVASPWACVDGSGGMISVVV